MPQLCAFMPHHGHSGVIRHAFVKLLQRLRTASWMLKACARILATAVIRFMLMCMLLNEECATSLHDRLNPMCKL